MTWTNTKLRDFFQFFNERNPNHLAAVDMLQAAAVNVMNDDADWVKKYREPLPVPKENYLETATKIVKDFEGFVPNPYLCPAGVWTIGYGTTRYSDGREVSPNDPNISEETAAGYLTDYIQNDIVPVQTRNIPLWNQYNDNQKATVISFAYNLGTYFYGSGGFNSITRDLSSPMNWAKVPQTLMLYVNPGSAFEAGLRRRREAEGQLWMGQGPYAE